MRAVSAGARGYPSICVPSTPASTMFARSWPEPSRLQSPEFALQRIVNGTPSRYAADADSVQSLTAAPPIPRRRFHGSSYDPFTLATCRMSNRDGP